MKRVYLDYAAATPIEKDVSKAMFRASMLFANPSAQYESARRAKIELERARKQIGMFLGANSDEIILTSGATEANNLATLGCAQSNKGGRIISLATEHASVREPLKFLKQQGFEVVYCPVDSSGLIDLAVLNENLTKNTILVSISYANSEIGTIQPISKINQIIREFESKNNTKIYFHTDASAAALLLSCDVSRLGVDMLTISSNKIYGPSGIGALYLKRGTSIRPIIFGGGQEAGLRSGTENLPLVVGFAEALKLVQRNRKADEKNLSLLTAIFRYKLFNKGFVYEIGHPKHKLQNIVSLSFAGVNGEDIVAYMDTAGFEIATGAACEAANEDPSSTLLALGLTKTEAQGTIRISLGRRTTKSDIAFAAKTLIRTLDNLNYQWTEK